MQATQAPPIILKQHQETDEASVVKVLAQLNQICLSAFKKNKKQELIFQMLNDSAQLVPYDRAVLWNMQTRRPMILGVSGQTQVNKNAGIAEHWQSVIQDLKNPGEIQQLTEESFQRHPALFKEIQKGALKPQILWVPLHTQQDLTLGMWVERWNQKSWNPGEIDIFSFLSQAYGASWEKFLPKMTFKKLSKKPLVIGGIALLTLLSVIQVPLRVVGTCEIVAKNPYVMTAPLNGIIEQIAVKPGQLVQKGDLLFQYDRRIPQQAYEVALKQALVTESELHRAVTASLDEQKKTLSEVAVLKETLERDRLKVKQAQQELEMTMVKAPMSGVVLFDNPDQWRGNPVQTGEFIMKVSDPSQTKIQMWIPEDDNIVLDHTKPVKVMLNISPEKTFAGKISYVSSYGDVNEKGVPGFKAEADWTDAPQEQKMGLKGTSILYGEDVSLFYWIVRRPWTTARKFLGF